MPGCIQKSLLIILLYCFHVSIKLFLEFNWFFFGGYIFWRMLKQADLYCSSTIYGSLLHAVSIEFLLLDNDLDNNL